jgi:outer membrane receptor protein involved in Fe transport
MSVIKQIIIGVLILLSTQNIAQNTSGKISGTVVDHKTNESIIGVQVYLEDISLGTTTKNDGSFIIDNVPQGTFNVQVKMIGYQMLVLKDVQVNEGQSTNLDIELSATTYKTGEVIIAASKMNSLAEDIPAALYVIDKKEIERSETRNIQDMLQKVSGVYTEDRRHNESNLISFRGVGLHSHVTRGILILVDGVSINEAMGRVSFESLNLQDAESIEILKGPVSALYGPNGITGVINVVSKQPSNEFKTDIRAAYGSYNSQRLAANVSGGLGAFNIGVSGAYYSNDGYMDRTEYSSNKLGIKLNTNSDFWGVFNISGDYNHSDANYGGTLDSAEFANRETISDNKFTGSIKDLIRFSVANQKFWGTKTQLSSNIRFRGRKDEGHYRETLFGKDDFSLFGAEVKLQRKNVFFNRENDLIIGVSADLENGNTKTYERDRITGKIGNMTDEGTSKYGMYGFYLQDQYELFDQFKLSAGVRYDIINYDWEDLFNTGDENTSANNTVSALSPKFGFTYNGIEFLKIYGNFGKGFNPPQVSQLFSSTSTIPNPNLKPEYLTNIEIGFRGNFNSNIEYQIAAYTMDFKDQVIAIGNNPNAEMYQNMGVTSHKGIESAINFNIIRNTNLYVNYAYSEAKFVDSPDYNINYIRKVPKNIVGGGIKYMHPIGISASLDYKWMDKYFMDNENTATYEGYSIIDAKVMYRWQGYFASVNVNNLLDVNYATYASYSAPSRYSAGGASYYPGWPRNFTFTIGISI